MNTEIRAQSANWNRSVELRIAQRQDNGKLLIVKDVEFTEIDQNLCYGSSLSIDFNAAQTLMDDLWNAGLRPTEGTGSAGSLLATQKHLNDMRKIVSKKLNIDL